MQDEKKDDTGHTETTLNKEVDTQHKDDRGEGEDREDDERPTKRPYFVLV